MKRVGLQKTVAQRMVVADAPVEMVSLVEMASAALRQFPPRVAAFRGERQNSRGSHHGQRGALVGQNALSYGGSLMAVAGLLMKRGTGHQSFSMCAVGNTPQLGGTGRTRATSMGSCSFSFHSQSRVSSIIEHRCDDITRTCSGSPSWLSPTEPWPCTVCCR